MIPALVDWRKDPRGSPWLACERCGLCRSRKHVVLGRGWEGADVLFLGEAPGKSEDVLGLPFVGPSGRLLEGLIARAAQWAGMDRLPRHYITNAVACRPCDGAQEDNRPPTAEEQWACFPRLEWEAKRIARPRVVIFLGKIAEAAARKLFPDGIAFHHPAYVLRQGGLGSPLGIKFSRDLSAIFGRIYAEEKQIGRVKPVRVFRRGRGKPVDVGAVHGVPRRLPPDAGRVGKSGAEASPPVRVADPRPPAKLVRGFWRVAKPD